MSGGDYIIRDRFWGRTVTVDTFSQELRYFLLRSQSDPTKNAPPEFLSSLLSQLEHLAAIMSHVTQKWRMWSSSILILYEGAPTFESDLRVSLRIVDFSHAARVEEVMARSRTTGDDGDDGYMFGVRNLIQFVKEIMLKSTV